MAKGITLRSSNLLLYLKDLQYKNPWVSRTQFFPWPRHVGRKHVGFFGRRPLGRRSIQDSLARSHILRTYVFTGHTPSYQRICPLPQLQILQYFDMYRSTNNSSVHNISGTHQLPQKTSTHFLAHHGSFITQGNS